MPFRWGGENAAHYSARSAAAAPTDRCWNPEPASGQKPRAHRAQVPQRPKSQGRYRSTVDDGAAPATSSSRRAQRPLKSAPPRHGTATTRRASADASQHAPPRGGTVVNGVKTDMVNEALPGGDGARLVATMSAQQLRFPGAAQQKRVYARL